MRRGTHGAEAACVGAVTLARGIFFGVQLAVGAWPCGPCLPGGRENWWRCLALPLVAAYPFMKRVTWWPRPGPDFQLGVLVGRGDGKACLRCRCHPLMPGSVLWTML